MAVILLAFAVIVLTAGAQSINGAITYLDATIKNTTLNGTALAPDKKITSGTAVGAMDDRWHLRTGVGNGGSVWTADESSSGMENVAPLVTTITFPDAGAYRIFAYVWTSDQPGADWDICVRLGSSGVYSRIKSSEAEPANPARFSTSVITKDGLRKLIQIPIGVVIDSSAGGAQVFIAPDATTGSQSAWYDGVGYEKIFNKLGERVIAIDFNKSNAPGAPSQAMFRSVHGSSSNSQNSTNIVKRVGSYSVELTKSSSVPFEFRGANGDSARSIPGGPTSLSFLVADFIGARDGTINIAISNLASGTYLFRSYHLDTFNSPTLGYAQGSSSTTPNTLRAHVGGSLEGIVQPTALGSTGLATNFISDADIPTLTFPIRSDGSNVVTIKLSTLYTNGSDRFILLNGFELFSTDPK